MTEMTSREGGCRERASRPSTAAYNNVVHALSAQTNLIAIDCIRRDDIRYFAENWPTADERIAFPEVAKAAAYSNCDHSASRRFYEIDCNRCLSIAKWPFADADPVAALAQAAYQEIHRPTVLLA
jgi:hypothetical protein